MSLNSVGEVPGEPPQRQPRGWSERIEQDCGTQGSSCPTPLLPPTPACSPCLRHSHCCRGCALQSQTQGFPSSRTCGTASISCRLRVSTVTSALCRRSRWKRAFSGRKKGTSTSCRLLFLRSNVCKFPKPLKASAWR